MTDIALEAGRIEEPVILMDSVVIWTWRGCAGGAVNAPKPESYLHCRHHGFFEPSSCSEDRTRCRRARGRARVWRWIGNCSHLAGRGVRRLGAPYTPVPFNKVLEDAFVVTSSAIAEAACSPLESV